MARQSLNPTMFVFPMMTGILPNETIIEVISSVPAWELDIRSSRYTRALLTNAGAYF
jgi:hypothetical protein